MIGQNMQFVIFGLTPDDAQSMNIGLAKDGQVLHTSFFPPNVWHAMFIHIAKLPLHDKATSDKQKANIPWSNNFTH